MSVKEKLIAEFKYESANTRKVLERAPEKSFLWKPHEKSMSLGRLTYHLAEIPQWVDTTISKDELDFAKSDYIPVDATTTKDLLKFFDNNISKALSILENTNEEVLSENWSMKAGDKIFFTLPKADVFRSFILSHTMHHRGQLTVYLRMLDVPVPSIYGPTADEEIM